MAESARTSDGRWSCTSDGRWSPSKQSRSPQHRARCKLDGERCVSLANIVQAFNVPIEEEQAWAICYQCAKCMSELVGHERSCLVSEMRHVLLSLDGSVHPNTFLLPPTSPTQGAVVRERASTEAKVVESLGLVIYEALDFKVDPDEERRLSAPLATLINCMTASFDDSSSSTSAVSQGNGSTSNGHHEADEGIEEDGPEVGLEIEQNATRFGIKQVLESCRSHLSNPVQSETHYKAVCRALVAEALELSTFLDKISSGSQELCLSGAGSGSGSSELVGLNVRDWARLWVQVIDELRRGVQLKKVGVSGSPPLSHPIEFALTPYEILMDDIRSRRYKLKQVMVNGDLPPRVKKDAHAVILDFIRSRPPLRPLAKRPITVRQQEPLSKHESLMESIRGNTLSLRPVTPGSAGSRTEAPRPTPHTDQPTRRIIKVDTNLLNFATSDEDDDLLTPVTPDIVSGSRSLFSQCASPSTNKPTSGWHKTVTLDLTTHGDVTRVERRHSITLCEQTPTVDGVPVTSLPPTKEAERQATDVGRGLFRSMVWKNSLECLSLTLDEVVHIRSVLTKAELENLLVGTPYYDDVSKGKLCFTCKKIRFSFFGPRGNKCRLCARVVCDKCSSKMRIPTEHFRNIPVYTLSPSPSSSGDEDSSHFSFWSSNNAHFVNANSGSAPSTPMVTPRSSHPPLVGGAPASLPPLSTRDSCVEEVDGVSSLAPRPTRKLIRSQTIQRDDACSRVGGASGGRSEEKLRGAMMTVCKECKSMVCHVIVASRNSLTLKHKSNKGNLNLNLYDNPWRSSAEAVSPTTHTSLPPPNKSREAITSQFRLNLTPFYTNDIGHHN